MKIQACHPAWSACAQPVRQVSLAVWFCFLCLATLPALATTNLSWRVEYDNQDRVSAQIDPAGRVTHYTYASLPNGQFQSVTQTPPAGTAVVWRFNSDGRLAAMTDDAGEVAYRYEKNGHLAVVARQGAPEINYAYDNAGRLAELRVGDFYRVAWTYDFLGRIAKMDTPAGLVTYEYLAGQNTVVRSLPNGIKTFWRRKANGQLDEITHGHFKNSDDSSYVPLAIYTYDHGPDGRITDVHESSGADQVTQSYMYDTMGRLVRAAASDGREFGYTYDLVGNRTKASASGGPDQICSYDWAGRLMCVDGLPCQYDKNGNVAEATMDGITRQYQYRPDGHIAEARAGNNVVQYSYDGFGRLISRKTSAGEVRFITSFLSQYWQPLVMEENGGKRSLVVWDGNIPLGIVRDGQVEWLLEDSLGTARLVTDNKASATRHCAYDPFGFPKNMGAGSDLEVGLAGMFWDQSAGLYLTLARAYDPAAGRFLQPDPPKSLPSELSADYSIYDYCADDPINSKNIKGSQRENSEEFPQASLSVAAIMSLFTANPAPAASAWQPH